jgi:tRNA pseudouridine synthase 2
MVTHPSAGHYSGTLVNALLHHCHLPAISLVGEQHQQQGGLDGEAGSALSDGDDVEEAEEGEAGGGGGLLAMGAADPAAGIVRPGVVHRLDKGTTGLLVVAKSDLAHQSLAQQARPPTPARLPAPRHAAWQPARPSGGRASGARGDLDSRGDLEPVPLCGELLLPLSD